MSRAALDFIDRLDLATLPQQIASEQFVEGSPYSDAQLFPELKNYEPMWFKYLSRMAKAIQAGEAELARIVSATFLWSPGADDRPERDVVFLNTSLRQSGSLPARLRSAYRNAHLVDACRRDTDHVFDLAAGHGLHSALLWLNGGPRDATYHAMEITRTGRLCTELLALAQPAYKAKARFFNFHEPDYSFLEPRARHSLIFTSGAVEQVEHLKPEVLTGILDRSDAASGVHFEPVGWQLTPHDKRYAAHMARTIKRAYNTNLWPLLLDLQSQGRIRITDTELNCFGKAAHMAARISWETV